MSNGIAHNNLNDISKIYLDTISDINKKEQEDDVKRWQQEESECGQNTRQKSPFKKKKVKVYKETLSNWRKDLREVTSDAEAVEVDDQPEIKEKKVKNKIKINPEFKEAVKQIGGELLEVKEVDSPDNESMADEKAASKEKKLKLRLLRTKMMAVKQGADDSIVAGYEPEGEQLDELSKTTTANYLYKAKVDKNYVHGGKMGKYAKARDKGIKRAETKLGKKTSDRVNYVADYDTRSMKQDSSKSAYPRKIKVKEGKEGIVDEGSAYGLYKGSGKPSGAMKDYLDKRAKKLAADKKKQKPEYRNNPAFGDPSHHSNAKNRTEEVEVQEKVLDKFETSEKERIVKGMKKDTKGFKKRYGDKWKSVMYATATKHAKEAGDTSKSDKRYAYEAVKRDEYGDPVGGPKISKKQKAKNLSSNTPDEQHTTTTSEMFGGSSSGGRADRGDEVGRKERVKRAQEKIAKRKAVKDTPISDYKPSPAMARYLAKTKKEEFTLGVKEEVITERQKDSDNQRLSQERGRSNYGKASIRNVRHTGEGGNAADPAERLVAIDKRHKAHKEKRGVKTKGIKEATRYKKEKGYDKGGTKKPSKDPALSAVVSMIRKKHGKSAIIGQGSRQQKKVKGAKSSTVGKYKKAADDKKQLKKDAKEMGYGSDVKGYIETRARYGSKENMKSGRGLGT